MGSAIAGLGTLAGGILGNSAAGSDRGNAQALTDQGVDAWQNLQTPTELANPVYFQNYQNAGSLTPAQEQTINTGPSQAAQTQANPALVQAQMNALQGLQQRSNTGMSSADMARLNQIQQQAATQAEGQKQSIMQQFAQRGQAGSGNQLLAELQAGQNATNQANQSGLQVAANAQQNALSALGQYGQQAGQQEAQQFGQQFQAGSAADLTNRFNVQNQVSQQARNVAQQNAAQQYNLQNQQNVMNANTGLTNQAQMTQRQGEQQVYSDQAQQAAGLSGASFTGANAYNNMGNQIAQGWTNVGSGVGQVLGGTPTNANGTGGSAGLLSGLFAEGGTVEHYDDGGTAGEQPSANTSLLSPTLTGQGAGAPTPFLDQAKKNQSGKPLLAQFLDQNPPATTGTAAPWEVGGGMAGGPSDPNDNSMPPAPGMEMPGQGPTQTAAHGGIMGYSVGGVTPGYMSNGSQTFMSGGWADDSLKAGGRVPGQAKHPGDDYRNDTVKAALSPGEVVIPRSVMQSENAPDKARQFVIDQIRQHGRKH